MARDLSRRGARALLLAVGVTACGDDTPLGPSGPARLPSSLAIAPGTPSTLPPLPAAGYDYAIANDVNDAGIVVGSGWNDAFYAFPVAWVDRVAHPLPSFGSEPGDIGANIQAINAGGAMAGYGFLGHVFRAGYWAGPTATAATPLDLLPGYGWSVAQGIADDGDVVGYASTSRDDPRRAVLWRRTATGHAPPVDLGSVARCPSAEAHAINSSDLIVGWGTGCTGPQDLTAAIVWEGGTAAELPGPGGLPCELCIANDVNDAGRIVGAGVSYAGGTRHRVVMAWERQPSGWVGRSLEPLAGYVHAIGKAVNAAGGMVGWSTDALVDVTQATLWYDGETSALATPLGNTGSSASAINRDGIVVGTSEDGSDPRWTATVWSVTLPPPNAPPVAIVNGPYAGNEGTPLTFSSAGTSDPEGAPLSYAWDFGDGVTSADLSPTHGYVDDGSYTVRLTVTDAGGRTATATTAATIANSFPVPSPGGPGGTIVSGQRYDYHSDFTDPGVNDGPWSWELSWGDGTRLTGTTPTQPFLLREPHVYVTPGTYEVRFSVTDADGATSVGVSSITVLPLTLSVDVRPGDDQNRVRLGAGGQLPVAVLSTPTFDATLVNAATARLRGAGGGTPVASRPGGGLAAARTDVDRDGRPDLVLQFSVRALQANGDVAPGVTRLTLSARLTDGRYASGQSAVRVFP